MKKSELIKLLQQSDDSEMVIDIPRNISWGTFAVEGIITTDDGKGQRHTSVVFGEKIWPVV